MPVSGGGKSGKFWIDDWRVEEVGPLDVLHCPGTPVTVRDSHGTTTYAEGRDYAPLVDSSFNIKTSPRTRVTILGVAGRLGITAGDNAVRIRVPELSVGALPCQHAYTFKITDSELMPE